ncbi:32380_t:CDS:2, partial [Gigaspora margarita]
DTSDPTPPSHLYLNSIKVANDNSVFGDLWILDIETYQWLAKNISNSN